MGTVLASSLIPSLILGLFSGSFINRHSKEMMSVGTDLIRGMVVLTMVIGGIQAATWFVYDQGTPAVAGFSICFFFGVAL